MGEDKEDIKQKILEAAKKRFDHYGFNKTTVEEIAEDANIGKGSVYSHFKSKKEILIALIADYNLCILKDAEDVFNSPLPVYERFLNLIITRFVSIYEYCTNTPHGFEVAEATSTIKDKLIEALTDSNMKMDDFLTELIKEGNQEGILNVKDPKKFADHISTSFRILYPGYKLGKSWDEARDYIETLVQLYFDGMRKH